MRVRAVILSILGFEGFFAGWAGAARHLGNDILLPPPLSMLEALWELGARDGRL